MIRFSYVKNALSLIDAVPELILINSHDATSAYTLRAGLFRPVCTNGLVSQIGDFGLLHVPHRGNVIHNVVDGALQIARGFNDITRVVERMAQRQLERPGTSGLCGRASVANPLPESRARTCRCSPINCWTPAGMRISATRFG